MLDHLFTPLALGPAVLPCRIVSTAHQTTLVHEHLPTEDFVAYQHARAQGGVGLIVMEAVAVAPSGLLTAHTIGGYLDGTADAYRRVAAAVQGEGTKLFVQLFHGGREVIASAPRPVISSASALPSHRFHTEPRAFRTAEVEDVVAGYARCAAIAAEAGLDGIEITAAHNYLLEQFFCAATNDRDDRYGEPARRRRGWRSGSVSAPIPRRRRRSPRSWRRWSTSSTWPLGTRRRSTAARASFPRRRQRAT
jgi:2,4-dienoyl-CoA reductase-like NADH-dependent reductase (Old Yellow Enzyme family)